jgi:predicted nucleic acid-binding protein
VIVVGASALLEALLQTSQADARLVTCDRRLAAAAGRGARIDLV